GFLEGEAVEDGGEHAHVVGGRFLDDLAAGRELSAAEDVAAADHDGQLHPALPDALHLAGDLQRLVDADAAAAGGGEALAAELQHDAAELGAERIAGCGFVHASAPGDATGVA